MLGGELSATSQEGVGSTFWLKIPDYVGVAEGEGDATRMDLQKVDDRTDRLLVLVIDDDPNVHDLLRENLGDGGYQVVCASSGSEGLRLARELQPFAITLDIMMPLKDGWQVLHELKKDPTTRNIPVIMLTIVDKQSLGYKLGASDYLVKPLEEEAVMSALNRLRGPVELSHSTQILVVDDDPAIPDLIRQLLEDESYTIEAVPDGQQALDFIRQASTRCHVVRSYDAGNGWLFAVGCTSAGGYRSAYHCPDGQNLVRFRNGNN